MACVAPPHSEEAACAPYPRITTARAGVSKKEDGLMIRDAPQRTSVVQYLKVRALRRDCRWRNGLRLAGQRGAGGANRRHDQPVTAAGASVNLRAGTETQILA